MVLQENARLNFKAILEEILPRVTSFNFSSFFQVLKIVSTVWTDWHSLSLTYLWI